MKKLVFAIAAAVLMAGPAFAAVQNVKVSGNITSSYVNRQDFDFNATANGQDRYNQAVFLTQTTLRVDADLSDNVSTTVGLINERAWGGENSASDLSANQPTEVDLYLAYVTLREFLYSPLTLSVGRQAFAFGNSFIFDATGTNNAATGPLGTIAADLTMRTSLDVVRATLDYKPLTIDVFAGKVSQANVKGIGNKKDDTDVYGINTNYQLGNEMNTILEAYVFGKNVGEGTLNGALGAGDATDKIWTPGLRVSTSPIKELNLSLEGALQRGNDTNNDKRNAYALQAMASLAVPVAELEKYKTSISGSYTYLSGDKNESVDSAKNSAWDPMFENQNGGTIFNTIFNLTNMQILNATISASPLADVTTSLSWNGLWAAQALTQTGITNTKTGYFVQPDASTFSPQVTSNKSLGNEYDANVVYQYTEDVKFGLNFGIFFPGRAFTAPNDEAAKQAIASVGVNF